MVGRNNLGGPYMLSINEAMDSDSNAVDLGSINIREMIYSDSVWLETAEGEGGQFPKSDIERILNEYYKKNF